MPHPVGLQIYRGIVLLRGVLNRIRINLISNTEKHAFINNNKKKSILLSVSYVNNDKSKIEFNLHNNGEKLSDNIEIGKETIRLIRDISVFEGEYNPPTISLIPDFEVMTNIKLQIWRGVKNVR